MMITEHSPFRFVRSFLTGVLCLAGGGLSADTYTWTGAVDKYWTNAYNWAEHKVPGQYYKLDGTLTGGLLDVAVFGDNLTDAKVTKVSFDGVYSISNLTTCGKSTRYTFGANAYEYIPIQPYGWFIASDASDTLVPTIACRLRLGVDCTEPGYATQQVKIQSENPNETLLIGSWGYRTIKSGITSIRDIALRFLGGGKIQLNEPFDTGGRNNDYPQVTVTMSGGLLTVNAETKFRALTISSYNSSSATTTINLTSNGSLSPSSTYNYLNVYTPTRIYGPGKFKLGLWYGTRSGVTGWYYSTFDIHNTLTLESPIEVWTQNATAAQLAAMETRIFKGGAGTLIKKGLIGSVEGEIQSFYLWGGSTVDVQAMGLKDKSVKGSLGCVDFVLGNSNARLRHSGPGETTDRTLFLTGTTATATFEFAGTGTMQLNSLVKLRGASSGTLKFENATSTPAVANCVGGTDVTLSFVKGPWTIGESFSAAGNIRLAAPAELTVGQYRYFENFYVDVGSGTSTVCVNPGVTLTFGNLTVASGAKVDFQVLDQYAKVIAVNRSVSGTVTMNGLAAKFNESTGVLEYSDDITDHLWMWPINGSWTEAAKWLNGVPTASSITKITMPGDDYTVTLDRDDLIAAGVGDAGRISVTNLTVRNKSDGTATLRIQNGAEVTFAATMVNYTDSSAPLHLETGSRLVIDDSSVVIRDRGNASGGQTAVSPLQNAGGTVEVCGTGQLVNVGREWKQGTAKSYNLNGWFNFGSGSYVFRDSSQFVRRNPETWSSTCGWGPVYYTYFRPTSSCDLTVEFLDDSHFNLSGWEAHFGANGRTVEFVSDTSYEKSQTFGTLVNVGDGNGVSSVRLKRGTYKLGEWMCSIATPGGDDSLSSSALFSTGRVEIASDATASTGHSYLRNMNIGQGLALTKDRGGAFVHGELLVAGEYWQQHGSFYVGAGPCADGLVHQTGGRVRVWTTDYLYQVGEVAVGLFGGTGLYTLDDGLFQTYRNVYVGGATTNDLHWTSHRNAALLQTYHDAQGEVRVNGGTFSIINKKSIILGADGTGTLTLSSTGTVMATTVIVSNTVGQAASALRFVSDAEGEFGSLNVQTLRFCEGSKLVIDATDFPTRAGGRTIFSLPNPVEGLAYIKEHVEIVNCPAGAYESWSADGRRLRFGVLRGFQIIVR